MAFTLPSYRPTANRAVEHYAASAAQADRRPYSPLRPIQAPFPTAPATAPAAPWPPAQLSPTCQPAHPTPKSEMRSIPLLFATSFLLAASCVNYKTPDPLDAQSLAGEWFAISGVHSVYLWLLADGTGHCAMLLPFQEEYQRSDGTHYRITRWSVGATGPFSAVSVCATYPDEQLELSGDANRSFLALRLRGVNASRSQWEIEGRFHPVATFTNDISRARALCALPE